MKVDVGPIVSKKIIERLRKVEERQKALGKGLMRVEDKLEDLKVEVGQKALGRGLADRLVTVENIIHILEVESQSDLVSDFDAGSGNREDSTAASEVHSNSKRSFFDTRFVRGVCSYVLVGVLFTSFMRWLCFFATGYSLPWWITIYLFILPFFQS